MLKSRAIRLAGAALLAAGLLALTLRQAPPGEVLGLAVRAPLWLLALSSLCALAFNLVRAARCRILLDGPLDFVPVVAASTTSWGVSLALPGLVGDAFLVWLLRRTSGVPLVRGAGVAVLARAADLASLALIALLVSPLAGVVLPLPAMAAVIAVGLGVAVVTAALLWQRSRRTLLFRASSLPRVGGLAQRLDAAFETMSDRRRLAGLAATTLLARAISAVEYMALFAAVAMPLDFWQSSFAVSTRTLLLAFPIQGLAGLGTTQLWWAAALALLGRPLTAALAAGLAVHLLDLAASVPVALIGAGLLARSWQGAQAVEPDASQMRPVAARARETS